MKLIAKTSWVLLLCLVFMGVARANPIDGTVGDPIHTPPVYLFWKVGCPYCAAAKSDLSSLLESYSKFNLVLIELGQEKTKDLLFERTLKFFEYEQAVVPLVVIGKRSFLGHLSAGRSAHLYEVALKHCSSIPCEDIVLTLAQSTTQTSKKPANSKVIPETIDLPILGKVSLENLSLPVMTVVLAAIDGFNPCAMWVLVFLIGLLMGLEDTKRMWLLGSAFLLATAAMYFAVMAAWLNLFLFLGAVAWVRIAIGVLAIGGGFFFLREYWTRPDASCRVANPKQRSRIMNSFRAVVGSHSLFLSVTGIVALAILVNFIELLCSAGIPAVYTQVLVLNEMTSAEYYAYLGLYISVFMLDDVLIFATAMVALRVSGLTGSYARYSHLIGGFLLLAIGAIILLRPELLSFS